MRLSVHLILAVLFGAAGALLLIFSRGEGMICGLAFVSVAGLAFLLSGDSSRSEGTAALVFGWLSLLPPLGLLLGPVAILLGYYCRQQGALHARRALRGQALGLIGFGLSALAVLALFLCALP